MGGIALSTFLSLAFLVSTAQRVSDPAGYNMRAWTVTISEVTQAIAGSSAAFPVLFPPIQ